MGLLATTFVYANDAPITIVSNGAIYTSNKQNPTTEAFAFREDEIVAVGSHASLNKSYPDAKQLDLKGATVVPGFIDAHGHLLGLGRSLIIARLMGTKNKDDIIHRLKKQAEGLPEGSWLLGRGWDQNDWPEKELPSAADLDKAFPDRPVWLTRVDGHAAWGNTKAMSFVDKDLSGDWQIDGGNIVRDKNGKATGVFIDNAMKLVSENIPDSTAKEQELALKKAMQKTASVGLTGMHDAGTTLSDWKLIKQAYDNNALDVRVYAMADGNGDMLDYLCKQGIQKNDDARISARAIKLYSDGALGSRGAALLKDYSDDPGNRGLLVDSEASLTANAQKAAKCGLQVNIHAIGDRGNRVTLNAIESLNQFKDNPGRHRVEHAQILNPKDFARFKKLSIIASVQPTHATSDMYWAEDRVGSERIKGAYLWQDFVQEGVPIALGSDFPVENPDPLIGFYAAVTRQDNQQHPEGGWYPKQILTREQALRGFTIDAAYAAFQEDKVGSIEAGKFADFVILSNDIMQVPSAEILDTHVEATYLAGQRVYHKD